VVASWDHPAYGQQGQEDDEQVARPPASDWASVSPDGTKLLFESDASGTQTIWISNRDGTNARPLIDWMGSIQTEPDWSPNGMSIVFASNHGSNNFNIWIAKVDGSIPTQLTAKMGNNRQPRVSPDGTKILFTSSTTGKRELWYMLVNGSNPKAIGLQSLRISDPSWSPDGTSVAYTGCTPPPSKSALSAMVCNVFTITLDAATATQVTTGSFLDWNPDWGISGIVFVSNRAGSPVLWLVSPNGSGLRQLTFPSSTVDIHPKWNRSTNTVIFTRGGNSANIWTNNLSGTEGQLTSIKGFISNGDVNGDGIVSCADVAVVKATFGSKLGQPGFDTRADTNGDGVVDIRDLAFVTQKLPVGTVCP
jgi:Tol biopolymer transport system component